VVFERFRDPKFLKKLHIWLFALWIVPGIPVSILLRNSVAWVVFLSVYAVVMQHLIEWHNSRQDAS
jgi:hypothetical protein